MKQISAMAAIPGMAPGATTRHSVLIKPAPSTNATSSISFGTSTRKERIIDTAIGRLIVPRVLVR
jgi:hypothetical protein